MAICLSPGGSTLYDAGVAGDFSRQLFVATQHGIAVLEEGEDGAWTEAARHLDGHHVCALLREPLSGNYYAGTHDAGAWCSADGRHWEPCGPGIDGDNVFSLASAVQGGKVRLYAGTEPAALFASQDLGQSWQRLRALDSASGHESWMFPAPPFIAHIKTIVPHPTQPDTVYVAVEQGGLYRSTDAGGSWTDLTAGMPNDAHRVAVHPQNPQRLYLSNGFFFSRSDDGGHTWTDMSGQTRQIGYADQLVYHPRRPELMFVAGAYATPDTWATGSSNSSVSRTRDGGNHWEYARGGFPAEIKPSFEAGCLEGAGDACRVFLGTTDGEVWMSGDEGESWQRIASTLPPVSKCFHADLIHGKLDLTEVRIPDAIRELMQQMVARG